MAFQTKTCLVLSCDCCGEPYEHDFTPHFDTKADAADDAGNSEWLFTDDDRAFCERCKYNHWSECEECGDERAYCKCEAFVPCPPCPRCAEKQAAERRADFVARGGMC